MAQTRLEKINTVYNRVVSLLRGGAIKEENKPLWLDIYKAFPPKYEPRFDRQLPSKPVRTIFYQEDFIRARFHKERTFLLATDLSKDNVKSATQNFLSMYKTLQKEENLSDNDAYKQAMQRYIAEENQRMNLRKAEKELSSN